MGSDGGQPPGKGPGGKGGGGGGFNLDSGLLLGIALVAVGLAALIMRGFQSGDSFDLQLDELAFYESVYHGGYPQLNVNTASREELLLLKPWISEGIADGIIEQRPFKMSAELLEVKGVEELDLEMLRMYLYGFEDLPQPKPQRPLGIPDA